MRAALGSAIFFALAPGVIAGAIPWWMTGWRLRPAPLAWLPLRLAGAAVALAGLVVLISAFWRFAAEGRGTPAPVAPTERLVIGGFYRYVRNPMYLAVLSLIVGQALALWQLELLVYAAVVCLAFVTFVAVYEEPYLARRFGAEYAEYRRQVPGWWPRRHPWRPEDPARFAGR